MLSKSNRNNFDGPIPGENFTSDVKNYPWHRPPTHNSLDEVVGSMVKSLNKPEKTALVLALLETNETILDVVTGLIRIGVANGRMSIDMGILAAGPMARMVEVIAEKAEIEYDRGWNQKPRLVTSELLRAMGGRVDPNEVDEDELDAAEQDEPDTEGLMSMSDDPASEEQQLEMLGSETLEDEDLV